MDGLEQMLQDALGVKDYNKASMILNQLWITAQISLTQKTSPELKELNFIKAPVHTDDGTYLLLLIHVDGKKIQLHGDENGERT